MAGKKFNVTINSVTGTLDNEIFKKMASKGDITSVCVSNCAWKKVTITGRAEVTIETDEKTFNCVYFNTDEYGIIHCGAGTMFDKSYNEYSVLTNSFIVSCVKCKMGKGYKAVPKMEDNTDNKSEDVADIPI